MLAEDGIGHYIVSDRNFRLHALEMKRFLYRKCPILWHPCTCCLWKQYLLYNDNPKYVCIGVFSLNSCTCSDMSRTLLVVIIFSISNNYEGGKSNLSHIFSLSGGEFALSSGWGQPLLTSVSRTLSLVSAASSVCFCLYTVHSRVRPMLLWDVRAKTVEESLWLRSAAVDSGSTLASFTTTA